MKRYCGIFVWLLCLFSLFECGNKGPLHGDLLCNVRILFAVESLSGSIEESQETKSEYLTDNIKEFYYEIYRDGVPIDHYWKHLESDFSSLTLEGLPDGSYSLVVFASTAKNGESIKPDVVNNHFVLINSQIGLPLDADWLFGRVDFNVNESEPSRTIRTSLSRCVGRLNVNIKPDHNPFSVNQITDVTVSFNEDCEFYTSYLDNVGSLSGVGKIDKYNITDTHGLFSLPSVKPLSGTISIKSKRVDGTPVEKCYTFENVNIERGKVTTLNVEWESGDGNSGFFRVRESDYNSQNYHKIFTPDEPRSVFYDYKQRSFSTDKPLKVMINNRKELHIQLYAPVDLSDVTIYMRLKRISTDFFKLATYDIIYGFSESMITMPLISKGCTFVCEDGRRVVVPAQPELVNEDCEFKVESSHPYMKKIAAIKYPIAVSFSGYSADDTSTNWAHMTPDLCKQACVLAVNFSYIFSSQEFVDKVNGWPGNSTTAAQANDLKDNSGVVIPPETVINAARGVGKIVMGTVQYVTGLGGWSVFGIAPTCYAKQYWDAADTVVWEREVMFHEFGHCMGYSHSSTMTYGDAWTRLGQELVADLGSAGKLPISNSKWESNY